MFPDLKTIVPAPHHEEEQTTDLINLIHSKFFSESPPCPKPLQPFRLIKGIAFNYLEPFIRVAMQTLMKKNYENQKGVELMTSSINTASALSIIYLGEPQAQQILDLLCLSISVPLLSEKQKIYACSLFDGYIITQINKDPSFKDLDVKEKIEKMRAYVQPALKDFLAYIQPIMNTAIQNGQSEEEYLKQLEHIFSNLDYNFNDPIIQSLEKDILTNSQKVNQETSFLYCIAGATPENADELSFEFYCLVEQYYCHVTGHNHFKVYQPKLAKTTVLHEMLNRMYGDRGENAQSLEEIGELLDNFKKYCSLKNNTFKNKILSGLSFRYYAAQFSPTDCIKNLACFLNSQLELKTKFLQKGELEHTIDSLSSTSLYNSLRSLASLKPFKLISTIAADQKLLSLLIKCTMGIRKRKYNSHPKNQLTSCVNTAQVVAVIVLGMQKAQSKMDNLIRWYSNTITISLPYGDPQQYDIANLFGGDITYYINREEKFDFLTKTDRTEKIKHYGHLSTLDFKDSLQPHLDQIALEPDEKSMIHKLKQTFSTINYKFNSQVLEKLKNEIAKNNQKVTDTTSFLYVIGLLYGSTPKESVFHHVFALEQFFNGKTCFHLYQSSINQATLLDDMTRLAQKHVEGIWDVDDLNKFLDQLTTLCCEEHTNPSERHAQCFGYPSPHFRLLHFDGKTLSGLNLRYFSSKVDPEACFKNLAELIQVHSLINSDP